MEEGTVGRSSERLESGLPPKLMEDFVPMMLTWGRIASPAWIWHIKKGVMANWEPYIGFRELLYIIHVAKLDHERDSCCFRDHCPRTRKKMS
ncbi:hypothetical protein Peur_042447 [Populus x canadensis]